MPLKQEQASPERPRCIGGANEHWGFRNPSSRETEQKDNINVVKATALRDVQSKDIFQLSWGVCEETRSTNTLVTSYIYSVYLSVTATVLQVISSSQFLSGDYGRGKKKKNKGVKKSCTRLV